MPGSSSNGHENKMMSTGNKNDVVSVSFVHFGEKSLTVMTSLFEETASNESVIQNSILKEIIQVLVKFKKKNDLILLYLIAYF